MRKTDRLLRTHNLTTTRSPTRNNFPEERYPARLRIHRPAPNQAVNGKFDGLFWRDTLKKRCELRRACHNQVGAYNKLRA
jgi:hypothetical protein